MEGREGNEPGYDDWFDEPAPPTREASRGGRGVYGDEIVDDDVWVVPDDEPRSAHRRAARREIVVAGRPLSLAQAAIIAASVVALLVAGLAAGGVFSSGGKAAASISTPSNPPTTATHPKSTTTPTTPAVTAPTIALNPGDTGGEVKTLQRALNALGYSVGKPDGDYGPNTEAAVKQFQTAKGLTADGVVGQQTLTALQNALSG